MVSWQALARLIRLGSLAAFMAAFALPVTAATVVLVMAAQGGGRILPLAPASAGLRLAMLSYGFVEVTGHQVDIAAITAFTFGVGAVLALAGLVLALTIIAGEFGTLSPRRAVAAARATARPAPGARRDVLDVDPQAGAVARLRSGPRRSHPGLRPRRGALRPARAATVVRHEPSGLISARPYAHSRRKTASPRGRSVAVVGALAASSRRCPNCMGLLSETSNPMRFAFGSRSRSGDHDRRRHTLPSMTPFAPRGAARPGGEHLDGSLDAMNEIAPGLLDWAAFHDGIGQEVHSHYVAQPGVLIDPMPAAGELPSRPRWPC